MAATRRNRVEGVVAAAVTHVLSHELDVGARKVRGMAWGFRLVVADREVAVLAVIQDLGIRVCARAHGLEVDVTKVAASAGAVAVDTFVAGSHAFLSGNLAD